MLPKKVLTKPLVPFILENSGKRSDGMSCYDFIIQIIDAIIDTIQYSICAIFMAF